MIGFALAVSAATLAPLAQASPAKFFRRDEPQSSPSGWTGKPVISGYWPSYQSELLKPNEIPYDMYTHIDWFVASTTETYELKLDGTEEELIAVVAGAHAAGVTVSMAVGGWTGSIFFSDLVANETSRVAFADSIKTYVDKYSLDGIDLDWEFPSVQGIGCNKINVENDSDNFLAFVETLRTALGPASRISAAIPIGGIKGPDGALYSKTGELAKYLDYMTIMAYDVYGSWSATTGPLGPWLDLCATPEGQGASGSTAVKLLTEAGFPANKLLLGMPSYSRPLVTESSTLTRTAVGDHSSLYYQNITTELAEGGVTTAEAGVDVCGTETPKGPSWLFNELISTGKLNQDASLGQGDWQRIWDHCSQTPFLFNPVNREFIPYDDPQSFETKASYASHLGLAGVNMFDMTGDTRDSMLIRAARKSLIH